MIASSSLPRLPRNGRSLPVGTMPLTGRLLSRTPLAYTSISSLKVCFSLHMSDSQSLTFTITLKGTAIYIVASTFEGAASFTPSVDGVILADNIAGGNTSNHLAPFWGVGGLSVGTNHTLNVTIGLNPNVTVKSNFELDALMYAFSQFLLITLIA